MHSVTLALDGGEWSASHPGHCTPEETALGVGWIGGWVSSRASLYVTVKKAIPSLLGIPVIQLIA